MHYECLKYILLMKKTDPGLMVETKNPLRYFTHDIVLSFHCFSNHLNFEQAEELCCDSDYATKLALTSFYHTFLPAEPM